jgi:hypothetical protein
MSAISTATTKIPPEKFPASFEGDQILIRTYGDVGNEEADNLPEEAARIEQRKLIARQTNKLFEESAAFWASGKDAHSISVQMDFRVGQFRIEAAEHAEGLKMAAERRKTEQTSRNSLSSKIFEAMEFVGKSRGGYPVEGDLRKAESSSSKAFADSRDTLIINAGNIWYSHWLNIREAKKPECQKKMEQFEESLKTAKLDHDTKELPPKKSLEFLQARVSLYTRNLERVYPKRSYAEKKIDEVTYSMRDQLNQFSLPEEKRAICEKKIESVYQELEAFKNKVENQEIAKGDPSLIGYVIEKQGQIYCFDFEKECLPKKGNS